MRSIHLSGALLLAMCSATCTSAAPEAATAERSATTSTVDSGFASVPESAWVEVRGPTLIGFYPVVSNEQLEADEGLATALDDFSYHVGAAMDSLLAAGFTVHNRSGDTLWIRTGRVRSRFVRDPDSASIGFVLTDPLGRRAVIYGVRTYPDLVSYAQEFKRSGVLTPR